MTELERSEQHAIRLATAKLHGSARADLPTSLQFAADATGLPYVHVVRLWEDLNGPVGCRVDGCGKPRGRGRPPKGWLRLHQAGTGDPDVWFHSWACVARNATERAGVA